MWSAVGARFSTVFWVPVSAHVGARVSTLVGSLVSAVLLAACATPSKTPPVLHFQAPANLSEIRWTEKPVVLLGEVHDNARGHQLRATALAAWLADGARPSLILEQFDREQQAAIDSAVALGGDADAVIAATEHAAASKSAWQWAFYKPIINLAIRYRLPLIAGNVSRTDTRKIIGQGLVANGFNGAVAPDILVAQAQAVVDGHCGVLNLAAAQNMVPAQISRDQFMAQMIEKHRSNGVVLIAGNGHVRKDIGVLRWLSVETQSRTVVVGYIEADSSMTAQEFDIVVEHPRQARPDPCEVFRKR
jgi:uncharacterized iron-regulated protein